MSEVGHVPAIAAACIPISVSAHGPLRIVRCCRCANREPPPWLFFVPVREPRRDLLGWHRVGKGIALCVRTAECEQRSALFAGFDALGDHPEVECVGETDHALHDAVVADVGEHVTDKGLVDLQLVCKCGA